MNDTQEQKWAAFVQKAHEEWGPDAMVCYEIKKESSPRLTDEGNSLRPEIGSKALLTVVELGPVCAEEIVLLPTRAAMLMTELLRRKAKNLSSEEVKRARQNGELIYDIYTNHKRQE